MDSNNIYGKITAAIGECLIFGIAGYFALSYFGVINKTPEPYRSWPLEHKETKKKISKNPVQIQIDGWESGENPYYPTMSVTVVNNFPVPVGSVVVAVKFKDENDIIVGEQEQETGRLETNEKWKLTYTLPSNAKGIQVSDYYAFEP